LDNKVSDIIDARCNHEVHVEYFLCNLGFTNGNNSKNHLSIIVGSLIYLSKKPL